MGRLSDLLRREGNLKQIHGSLYTDDGGCALGKIGHEAGCFVARTSLRSSNQDIVDSNCAILMANLRALFDKFPELHRTVFRACGICGLYSGYTLRYHIIHQSDFHKLSFKAMAEFVETVEVQWAKEDQAKAEADARRHAAIVAGEPVTV